MPVTTRAPVVPPPISFMTGAKVGLSLVTHVAAEAEANSAAFRLATLTVSKRKRLVMNCPPMARVAAAKVLLDRGWGKPKEMHHSEVDDNKPLLKVVNEIVHVYETREEIEFKDQTPLLEINPSKNGGNTH